MQSPYSSFIVIDVETGGLPNAKKKAVFDVALTEVAFVVVNKDLEITESKSWLIKPYKEGLKYNPEAAKTSGITKEMCEEQGMDLAIAVKEMIMFLKKHKDGSRLPVVLGHNFVKFDSEFMLNAFEFCKEDLLKYVQPEPEDTLKWARLAWTESTNYKLGTCCENVGITLQDAHRAMTDTVATAKLWVHFLKQLRGQGELITATSSTRYRDGFEL